MGTFCPIPGAVEAANAEGLVVADMIEIPAERCMISPLTDPQLVVSQGHVWLVYEGPTLVERAKIWRKVCPGLN